MPKLEVTSLADIAAPSLAGPCVDDGLAGVLPGEDGRLPAGGRRRPRAARELQPPALALGRARW